MNQHFTDERLLVASDIVGVRSFVVDRGTLRSVIRWHEWDTGVNLSRCLWNPLCLGVGPKCSCGFYAYFQEEHAAEFLWPGCILGLISGTGKATAGTRGFRVERAEIVALIDPHINKKRQSLVSKLLFGDRGKPLVFNELDGVGRPSRDMINLVRETYPNVPFYPSLSAALEEHPLTFIPEGVKLDA